MRRASALLLLVVALASLVLGALIDPRAASCAGFGAFVVALVAFLDVDKLTGRG